ncbi:MAG: tRNA (adenine-N1)-methyltransferase [Chloroflexi bacterium]|nr:tRNA (adenine-N1)-methyltransferase [Chloroflexota bacterium]
MAQLVSPTNKSIFIRLIPGGKYETHRGILYFDDLIGKPWGSQVESHTGQLYVLLQPGLADLLQETRRNTQIMYPKDIGFILLKMGIINGSIVVEAGTGSGALTTALALFTGEKGHVYSYDIRQEMQILAKKNLDRLGLTDLVTLKLKDIGEGFDEKNVDALFLDLPNPYDYMDKVRECLKPGGQFGCILPTTNQVSRLLFELHRENFAFVDVCEIMLRYFKPAATRLRPTDRMVAHTGYLIFARPIIYTKQPPNNHDGQEDLREEEV